MATQLLYLYCDSSHQTSVLYRESSKSVVLIVMRNETHDYNHTSGRFRVLFCLGVTYTINVAITTAGCEWV